MMPRRSAKVVVEEPLSIFTELKEFLQGVYDYIYSTQFVGKVLASVLVVFLGVLSSAS